MHGFAWDPAMPCAHNAMRGLRRAVAQHFQHAAGLVIRPFL